MFFTLTVRMDIVSLNQLDMTQEELRLLEESLRSIPLEELNKITIKRMVSSDNSSIARRSRTKYNLDISIIPTHELNSSLIAPSDLHKKYGVSLNLIKTYRKTNNIKMTPQGSNRWITNGLDVIPLEELHDSNIMAKELSVKYNVNRHRILNYRKEHNIPRCKVRPNRRKNPMSVVPIDELNNGRIATYELAEKYRVCKGELGKYRREHNIKFIRPSGYSRPRRKK